MTNFSTVGKTAKAKGGMYAEGKVLRTIHAEFDIVHGDLTNGDVFILGGAIPLSARIHRIISPNASPALTSANDNDFGFYTYVNATLTAIDADILVDGGDLSSALSARDLLNNLNASLDQTKTIGELLGKNADQNYAGGVYLCITINTKATASGKLDLDIQIEDATTN